MNQTAPDRADRVRGDERNTFRLSPLRQTVRVPLVLNLHYLSTMDYWDPAMADALAHEREVILFDNAGVSSSSGEVPTTFEQMGANAIAFSRALV